MISLIVAMDKNRVIGRGGGIPWHLSSDFAYFKRLTNGHPIIMGRKTFESIGRALPGRTNIVITSNESWSAPDCECVGSLQEAIDLAEKSLGGDELFVIGGGIIFAESMRLADRLYVTEVDTIVTDGDTFFPVIDPIKWYEISRERHMKDEKNDFDYSFVVYDKQTGD